jgi:hypothetical protein
MSVVWIRRDAAHRGGPAASLLRSIRMAKGQLRSNREAKKPKQPKKPAAPVTPTGGAVMRAAGQGGGRKG